MNARETWWKIKWKYGHIRHRIRKALGKEPIVIRQKFEPQTWFDRAAWYADNPAGYGAEVRPEYTGWRRGTSNR